MPAAMDDPINYISQLKRYINFLLPFTNPMTPLAQDVIHTLVLCVILWYAPRIMEREVERQMRERDQDADLPAEQVENQNLYEDGMEIDDDEAPIDEQHPNAEALLNLDEQPQIFADQFQQAAELDNDPAEGPANRPGQPRRIQNREVGKKKAASIARRDQRRAYHEFQRQQGDAQRAKEKAEEEALQVTLAEEKQRRALIAQQLEQKHKAERESRKVQEQTEREAEMGRRMEAVRIVRESLDTYQYADLDIVARTVDGDDAEWVEKLIKVEGIVSREVKDGVATFVTRNGFAVRVTAEDMAMAQHNAAIESPNVMVSREEFSYTLEDVIRRKQDGLSTKSKALSLDKEVAGASNHELEVSTIYTPYLDIIRSIDINKGI